MPTIFIPTQQASTPVDEPPAASNSFIRLGDEEVYTYNGHAWVGVNGARIVCALQPDVVLGDAVVLVSGIARKATSNSDTICSGVVTHITPAGVGVVTSAGRVNKTTVVGARYFLDIDGALTTTPNPDTQHIVLIGTGEGDTLLLTIGVASESPI
jgi:uncharacterized protein YsxB (DUF464 family)